MPLVYDELRAQAELDDHTLQPTALVHGAYIRLIDGQTSEAWNSSGHFFAAASEAMRRILVHHSRHKFSKKQGDGPARIDLDDHAFPKGNPTEFPELDEHWNSS